VCILVLLTQIDTKLIFLPKVKCSCRLSKENLASTSTGIRDIYIETGTVLPVQGLAIIVLKQARYYTTKLGSLLICHITSCTLCNYCILVYVLIEKVAFRNESQCAAGNVEVTDHRVN
jgi:hypothetical protein